MHRVVGYVGDGAQTATALQVPGECGGCARPDFYPGAVGGVGHGDVVDLLA